MSESVILPRNSCSVWAIILCSHLCGSKTTQFKTGHCLSGSWVQADRVARPSQSIFLPGDERNAYLAAALVDDARFIAIFAHSLEHIGGYSSDEARPVAGTLLPDILHFDPNRAATYSPGDH